MTTNAPEGVCGKARGGECFNCQPKPTTAALRQRQKKELAAIASSLVASGKGILAADESTAVMGKALEKIGVKNDPENRRQYRQLLFTAGKEAFNNISGVIIFHETLYQKDDEGVPLIKRVKDNGALVGIKVDKGLAPLAGTRGEQTTQGLDGLEERCKRYKLDGCDFAKWRCTYNIGERTPSNQALTANANILARYATCCQQAGLVPILQAEILADGDHCLAKTEEVLEQALSHLYRALQTHHVWIEGTILATSVVKCGQDCAENGATPFDIAGATLVALLRSVPACVPGVAFVTETGNVEETTTYLDCINKFPSKKPWMLTFCYRKTLQESALMVWKGDVDLVAKAQKEFARHSKICAQASLGRSKLGMEGTTVGKKLIPPEQLY